MFLVLLIKYLYGESKIQELVKHQKKVGESRIIKLIVKTNFSVDAIKEIMKESKELKINSCIYEKLDSC